MAAISGFARSCLNMQGFTALDDQAKARFNLALRFTPALCLALTLAGVALASPVLLGALAASAALALVLPGGHPFDYLYNHGVRHLAGAPVLPPNPAPRRFAFVMATGMLTGAAVSFAIGAPWAGDVFGALQLAGCGIYVVSGLCVGSFLHGRLFGPPQERPAEPTAGVPA